MASDEGKSQSHFMNVDSLGRQECLLFNPSGPNEWLKGTFTNIPRYLFHVSTPKSDGETSPSWAKSKDAHAARTSSARDIFSRSQGHVTSMLHRHLERRKNVKFDNFVTWTSSLLFALQYVFYRHQEERSPLDSIKLYVIDTTKFPSGVFVRDLDLLSIYRPYNAESQYADQSRNIQSGSRPSYTAEYLSQGALSIEGKCGFTSAQKIIDNGLFSLRPEFRASKRFNLGLGTRVVHLRKVFELDGSGPKDLENELHAAISIAELFGPPWRVPMAAALMALRPSQNVEVDTMCRNLLEAWPEMATDANSSPRKEQPFKQLPPEVHQFEAIMNAFDKHVADSP